MHKLGGFLLVAAFFSANACSGSQKADSNAQQPAVTVTAPPEAPATAAGPAPSGATASPTAGGAECATDADCVPASCCHASACVAKASAPNCDGMVCTEECRSGTIDCGGACYCNAGKCNARLIMQ